MKIHVEKIIDSYIKFNSNFTGKFLRNFLIKTAKLILYEERINQILDDLAKADERSFINELFDLLEFSYSVSNKDLQKVPSEGRVICVANHPIGSLDSLSILKIFLEVRSDVKIIANDVLLNVDNLKNVLLPINLFTKKSQRENLEAIQKSLEEENAVIIFPAGKVSRLSGFNIMDSKWNKGAIYFSKKTNSPILPVYINSRNSLLFYFVSLISQKISTFLLVHELFNKKGKTIQIKIGDIIPSKAFANSGIIPNYQIKLLKRHVYNIGKNGKSIFSTEKNVIHPVDRRALKRELNNSQLLSMTPEGYKIYLISRKNSPQILNEIGRLREITFRKVGEGTGKKLDVDKFDDIYKHLIIWDESELEIVGSYRLGIGEEIIPEFGASGFYTSTLFNFSKDFEENILPYSIELGRSFIQKKYWNTNVLYYLWQGIGAFLLSHSSVKYLFGGVSISNSYSQNSREMIVYFYETWFGNKIHNVSSKNKFIISSSKRDEISMIINGQNYRRDLLNLKDCLKAEGFSIPILYKHYTELCDENGVQFLDFGIDNDFENCVDGLILLEVEKIKNDKKKKFFKKFENTEMKITA